MRISTISPFRSHKYFRRESSAVFHSNNLAVEETIGRCSYIGLILLILVLMSLNCYQLCLILRSVRYIDQIATRVTKECDNISLKK